MKEIKLISNPEIFHKEFERCCNEYTNLEIFTAWVGHPGNILPYGHLDNLDNVEIFLGISFDQSSPEGIEYLMAKKYKVVIIDDNKTYHPKLYFFTGKGKVALLMGSSNFTYGGFFENTETNILLEGPGVQNKIKSYLDEIKTMVGDLKTFVPDEIWLEAYRLKYIARQEKLKRSKVKEETVKEDKLISSSSWLSGADWATYLKHIRKGIRRHLTEYHESVDKKLTLFKEYETNLEIPWTVSLLDTIENRRRILGKQQYGWLGHIGASGRIQYLLSNGTLQEKRTIVNSVNRIANMQAPLNFSSLKRELDKMTKLGPTIKVWGRMLAIVRPDIFCTISSPYVRESLSVLLQKSQSYFETTEGYIELLRLIHQSPWYNKTKPKDKSEEQIWKRRVAFLDVIFY
jgi:hypothetical protein